MTKLSGKERIKLVNFCIDAVAYLEDIPRESVDESLFTNMTDKTLQKEADWYDQLLNK